MDELARRVLWYSATESSVIAGFAAKIEARTAGPISVALASTHGSGHVRERAVRLMVEAPIPELMPFLVLRTADWVQQVRDQARAGLAVALR